MKKGFSLVEVIIAITLLSIVLTSLLQIKENNLFLFDKFNNSIIIDNELAILSSYIDPQKDEKIYIKDKIDFKDDDIRKLYKDSFGEVKSTELDPIEVGSEDYPINLNITESFIQLKQNGAKKIYSFRLEY